MHRHALILLALPLTALAGCGDSRTLIPDLSRPAAPAVFHTLSYPSAGVTLQVPDDWTVAAEQAPLVTVVSSGDAVVAVWRFPRSQPLPADRPALEQALSRLIQAVRVRDPAMQLIRSRVLRLAGAVGVEIDAMERIGSAMRRVRSTHLYAYGSEIVLEEYAPVGIFHAVDHAVFSPVKRSFQISAT